MMQPGGLALRMKRIVGAPASAVFRACTESEELAQWWGPRGFTTPAIEIDLRVDPASRLVYTFVWELPDPDDREMVVTLSFATWMD